MVQPPEFMLHVLNFQLFPDGMIRNPACGTTLDGQLKPSKIGLVGHPGSTHFSGHPGWTSEAAQSRLQLAIQGGPTGWIAYHPSKKN